MQRWGLTVPLTGIGLPENADLLRRAEAAGYTDFWSGETNGPDGFTPLALASAWTEKVRLGTGVVGVMQRGRALLAQEAAALADASGGRFALGIGASSDRIIEGWNAMPFEKPLTKMSETLDFLRTALAGERADGGFKLERAPAEKVPIILAALRGKMLKLAVEKADGAFTNFLPLAGLPKVAEQLKDAPDGFELLCRFFCIPGEREQVEPLARFMFSSYITVPVYENFYRWLGYGEKIDLVRRELQVADACVPRRLQQHEGAEDVRRDEVAGVLDRAVDVGLRGEVDDRIAALDRRAGGVAVGDVGFDQLEAVLRQPAEVLAAAGVGQLVEHPHGVIGVFGEAEPDVVRADEAGAAGDQELHAASAPSSLPSVPSSHVTSSSGGSLSPVISSPSASRSSRSRRVQSSIG